VGKSERDSGPDVVRGMVVDPGVGAPVAGSGSALAVDVLREGSGAAAVRLDVQPVNTTRPTAATTAARWLLLTTVTGTG
jgi:hypothetical protein